MRYKSTLLFTSIVLCANLSAQLYDPNSPPNTYRNIDNPLYWKNRKPIEGYWQQDVYYKIKANIDDKTDIVDGQLELTYWNNSPDTLHFVYFHLYSNAQTKDSYLADLYKNNKIYPKFGKYQSKGLGTNVNKISSNGIELKTEEDNTILKVILSGPLKPNEEISFHIEFKSYFDNGSIRDRKKMFNSFGYKHYDLVHWYPRISVYDKKFGWDTDQHMDHEFYGDFGTYDVELSFPNNYIVEGTGNIQNKSEVLPNDLRAKLDIKNFITKPWNEKPSEIIKPDGTTKAWKFYAENVHDFAATADPTYRIGESEFNGIKCISLVQEPHATGWINASAYTAKVVQVYSEDFGMYVYPKMVVADAQDGMEYPMLTLDGGFDPSYRDLLAHEIGHNWFFGMVGSNETYRPCLDEGFTQFISNWAYEKINGNYRVRTVLKSKYIQQHLEPDLVRFSEVYNPYIEDAIRGIEATLNTHSDGFNGAIRHGGGYRQVYFKTATMLYNLQYVLGDSLFKKAMQHYFSQWMLAHPYIEDFRASVINYTHVDLNWFFDQWFETSKTIDYSVKSVQKRHGEYAITFKRKGRMQMPIDFTVISDSTTYNYHIPNTWFVKKTNATVLPHWIGWDKVKETYQATIKIPGRINNVIIDPTARLADVNMLNNSKRLPVHTTFDSQIYNSPDWLNYKLFYRPDLWYSTYDGLKVGFHLSGNYFNYKHILNLSVWLNTGLGQGSFPKEVYINKYDDLNFNFSYQTPLDQLLKGTNTFVTAKHLEGIHAYTVGLDRKDNSGKNRIYAYYKSMIRLDSNKLNYLLLPGEWGVNMLNNTINIGLDHSYSYKFGSGLINLNLRSSTLLSDYDQTAATLTVINKNKISKKINFNSRVFAQYGTGTNWAKESSLFLASANPEEMMENKYTRSQGFFSQDITKFGPNTNNFHYGGGLNLRGYSGYFAPELRNDSIIYSYKGTSGLSINIEIEFNNLLGFNPKFLRNWLKLTPYLFADAGTININKQDDPLLFANIRMDAGAGLAATIKKFGPLQTVNPLTIRFDVPMFLNRIPATDKDYIAFRWVIGISRAF